MLNWMSEFDKFNPFTAVFFAGAVTLAVFKNNDKPGSTRPTPSLHGLSAHLGSLCTMQGLNLGTGIYRTAGPVQTSFMNKISCYFS